MRKYSVYIEQLNKGEQDGHLYLEFEEDEASKLLDFCNTVLQAADHEVSVYIRRRDDEQKD